MPQKILACVAYDETTDTCTTQAWIDQPSLLPSLTIEQGFQIGGSIALLWATAFIFRFVRKPLKEF